MSLEPGWNKSAPELGGADFTFTFAIGMRGVLRLELVDRVEPSQPMEFEPRDPRCIFIGEDTFDGPTMAHARLTFVGDSSLEYKVTISSRKGASSEMQGPVDAKRRPFGETRLNVAAIETSSSVALEPEKYAQLAWFVWTPKGEPFDASQSEPAVAPNAPQPTWFFRARFTPK